MNSIQAVKADKNGIVCSMKQGVLRVTYVSPSIVRIRCTLANSFSKKVSNICISRETVPLPIDIQEDRYMALISNGKLQVSIDKASGALTFKDAESTLFREPAECPRTFDKISIKDVTFDLETAKDVKTVDGGRVEAKTIETGKTNYAWAVRQNFVWAKGEALYGFGSHEEDVLNLRGSMQYVYQQNMKAAVPVLVSSKGYGILFDATCEIEFHDDKQGSFVALDAVDELDYYVIYGSEFDNIVAGYRELTGRVPMLPRWSFGYCQSKERYQDQQELINIVKEYRKRKLPLDLIVQDWKYWPTGWGIKEFDTTRYPNPTAMCERIHELNAHFMLSIWPIINGDHPEPKEMQAGGHMLKNNRIYDAYSESARAEYWKRLNDNLFKHGIDAWWCDCTEPVEADWNGTKKLSRKQRRDINTRAQRDLLGRKQVSSYSLLHSKGIYENQRKTTEAKRVINLTRSAYAGQQRYGTITWSGDIAARWEVLAQQIACGLNFTVTGCPYWTNDIGAFFVKKGEQWFWNGQFPQGCNDLGYRELYTRWFQYGVFLPMFRSHGTDTPREIWSFGKPGEMFYDTLVKYLHLRYRLLPYIYSLAGMTTQEHYTMMRALAFDFRTDSEALDVKTQYMFGPAFMVCPVTTPMYYGPESEKIVNKDKTRQVYLPKQSDWYDFWTGERLEGGQTVISEAPLETMPLYVRAGSIVPMGPLVQYTDENLNADWDIHIYPGADVTFTVYEDCGDGYEYEDGKFATWQLEWQDATSTLLIGKRKGSFPGMSDSRVLKIFIFKKDADNKAEATFAKKVRYAGRRINIKCHTTIDRDGNPPFGGSPPHH